MTKIYEVWYEFYDGTQANNNGYHEKVKTFSSKEKAYATRDKMNENAQFPSEKPYYVKEVELDD